MTDSHSQFDYPPHVPHSCPVEAYFDLLIQPFTDAGSRFFYWQWALTALVVLAFGTTRKSLNWRYWWNPSTQTDLIYYCLNAGLKLVLFLSLLDVSLQAAGGTYDVLAAHFGDFTALPMTFPYVIVFTLIYFILHDGLCFLHHWAMHRVPFLWHIHKIHHQATVLTPLTLFRVHPLESAMVILRNSLSIGLATGVFVYLFSAPLSLVTILGVNAIGFTFNSLASNLRHSHIPLSFGPLEKWIISPRQHQIHHSRYLMNANYGVHLAVWDRLIGSLYLSKEVKTLRFGVRGESPSILSSFSTPLHLVLTQLKTLTAKLRSDYWSVTQHSLEDT